MIKVVVVSIFYITVVVTALVMVIIIFNMYHCNRYCLYLHCFVIKVMKTLEEVLNMRDDFFGPQLNEHCDTYEPGVVRDISDALLAEYSQAKAKKQDKTMGNTDDIKYILMNIFVAASDTSASVLTWFMLYMVVYKNVQRKVQNELDAILGENLSPRWKDAEKLPYLQATTCEVMRHSNFVPINLPHKAVRNSSIEGYHIPKDTTVLFNFASIHSDPEEWQEPTLFKPERFLDKYGNFLGWNALPGFLPFGAGRRMCVGENLGKMQVFMVVSKVLHRFRLEPAEGKSEPKLESNGGVIRYPKEYKIRAIKRF